MSDAKWTHPANIIALVALILSLIFNGIQFYQNKKTKQIEQDKWEIEQEKWEIEKEQLLAKYAPSFSINTPFSEITKSIRKQLLNQGYVDTISPPKYSIELLSESQKDALSKAISRNYYYFYNPSNIKLRLNDTPFTLGVVVPKTELFPSATSAHENYLKNLEASLNNNIDTIVNEIKNIAPK